MPKFNPFNKGRIFIVDELNAYSTLAVTLRGRDFAVTEFTDAMNAQKAARPMAPDILISELAMSPISGIDLAIRFQKCCPNCKVLLLTCRLDSAELLEIAHRDGLQVELIPKTVDPKVMIQKVLEMTKGTPRSAAKELAMKTYNDNAQKTLSRLRGPFAVCDTTFKATDPTP
jgi:DNA-binding NtrC family response regulator